MAEDPQSIHKKQIKNIDPEHTRLPTSTWPDFKEIPNS